MIEIQLSDGSSRELSRHELPYGSPHTVTEVTLTGEDLDYILGDLRGLPQPPSKHLEAVYFGDHARFIVANYNRY